MSQLETTELLVQGYVEKTLTGQEQAKLVSQLDSSKELQEKLALHTVMDRVLFQMNQPSVDVDRVMKALPVSPRSGVADNVARVIREHSSLRSAAVNARAIRMRWAWGTALALAASVLVVLGVWRIHTGIISGGGTAQIASIQSVSGNVELRHGDSKVPAAGNMAVYSGDCLVVDDAGETTLKYADDSTTLQLLGGSRVTLANPCGAKNVTLDAGELVATVARQAAERPMILTTPHAVVTVRGTELRLVIQDRQTAVSVIEGKVEVSRTGRNEGMSLQSGEYVGISATGINRALMGSEGFLPLPEHPVGWRGDWTGKYPGSAPPLVWHRLLKTPLQGIKNQADKPVEGSEKSLDPVGVAGQLKNWMILGPFAAGDMATALDRELVQGEANFSPETAKGISGKTWQLAGTLPNSIEGTPTRLFDSAGDEIAYAHTYVFAPEDVTLKATVRHPFGGIKIWLNGKCLYNRTNVKPDPDPQDIRFKWKGDLDLPLVKGWNRILTKVSKVKGVHVAWKNDATDWQFGLRLNCSEIASNNYETKNILWMSKAPHTLIRSANASSPVVAGDPSAGPGQGRIFFTAEPSDLICMSIKDGRVLWVRSNNPYELMDEAGKRAIAPETRKELDNLTGKLRDLTDKLVKKCNEADHGAYLTGANQDTREALDEIAAEKLKIEKSIYALLATADRNYVTAKQTWGNCNHTPICDGKRVYVQFATGVVACYDLNGAVLWKTFIPKMGSEMDGVHGSPALAGNRMVVLFGTAASYWANILALDARTGKEAWRMVGRPRVTSRETGMLPGRFSGEDIIITSYALGLRASDGKQVWGPTTASMGEVRGFATPVAEKDIFYKFDDGFCYVVKLPACEGEMPQMIQQIEQHTGVPGAAPLYHNGLLYCLGLLGQLCVFDPAAGKLLREQQLDLDARESSRMWCGCSSSPALAGGSIYIPDNSGTTIVIEPGVTCRRRARNVVDNICIISGEREQEQFPSNFAYVGNKIIMRGQEFVYCIGEQ